MSITTSRARTSSAGNLYKHQLRSADGVEGWSEFGRAVVLQQFVDSYEQVHGEMTGGEHVELPSGRRVE